MSNTASRFTFWGPSDPQFPTPVLTHPGGEGWPPAPKITEAEARLYGDLAESVRLLGMAVQNATDAYALACKAHQGLDGYPADDTMETAVKALYELQDLVAAEHRTLASKAIERQVHFSSSEFRLQQEEKITGARDDA